MCQELNSDVELREEHDHNISIHICYGSYVDFDWEDTHARIQLYICK